MISLRPLSCAICAIWLPLALNAEIQWDSKVLDFGTFHEESGKVTGDISFRNLGPDDTCIRRVRTSCGCTAAAFTEGTIPAGESASITITYNPKGRPGRFEKHVRVYTGDENTLTTITVRGMVIGAPQSLALSYPIEAGPLRFNTLSADNGDMFHGDSNYSYISAYNISDQTLMPLVQGAEAPISVIASSKEVGPGETITFSILYDSRLESEMGEKSYSFAILPNADEKPVEITVLAALTPDTRHMTPQEVANAPRAFISPSDTDIGNVSGNKSVAVAFDIRNDGNSDMSVNRIYSSHPSVAIRRIPSKVKKGKKETTHIIADLKKIDIGPFRIPVNICTDDPIHPVREFYIIGNKLK